MAEKFNDNSSQARRGEDDPRAELAGNWAQMTAAMVSPKAQRARKGANGKGPTPLPVSALPVPDDPADDDLPKHLDLPRNSKGELTPAQRARLGLDLDPSSDGSDAQSAAPAQDAPPVGQPPQPPSQRSAPRAQPQDASLAPDSSIGSGASQPNPSPTPAPAHLRPAPTPAQQRSGAPAAPSTPVDATAQPRIASSPEPSGMSPGQPQPGSEFDFRAMERPYDDEFMTGEPALKPVTGEPRLAPVSEPRLAPVGRRSDDERTRDDGTSRQRRRGAAQGADAEDEFQRVVRDRNVLTYGVAWTAFAIVVTAAIAFTSSMSGDPSASAGPGPLIPGLLSVAMGWIVVIAARGMGRGWWALMALPALVLFIGPYVYTNFWAGSVEDAARSYLSQNGADIQIDVDATSVVSATKNTDRGCFAITRTRRNYDTEVAVATYAAETARQQADYALAPRYAGRIEAGGERSTYRVFTFKGGRAPAIVTTPTSPPLDCARSTSAPGTGAKSVDEG